MASLCPDNSTSCLLRALVDANSGYNWNPLTFAFTAIIGVLALVFTFVAVIQGFLAAGPGRLKASRAAVGAYESTAVTRFDWTELRFRTTVEVPVLTLKAILRGDIRANVWEDDSIPQSRRRRRQPEYMAFLDSTTGSRIRDNSRLNKLIIRVLFFKMILVNANMKVEEIFASLNRRYRVGKAHSWLIVKKALHRWRFSHSRSLAGWSNLLVDLNLDRINFDTRICSTDYLPTDIQAAPAYATVDILTILALVAGCESPELSQEFPVARGPYTQLDFRPHPVLGVVAVYQRYLSDSEQPTTVSRTRSTVLEALGCLAYKGQILFQSQLESDAGVSYILKYQRLSTDIEGLRLGCDHTACGLRNRIVPSWRSFLQFPHSYKIGLVAGLLFADKPWTAELFPAQATLLHGSLNKFIGYCEPWLVSSEDVLEVLKLVPLDQHRVIVFREAQGKDFVQVNRRHSKLARAHLRADIPLQFATPFQATFDHKSQDRQVTNTISWLANSQIPIAGQRSDSVHARPLRNGIPLDPETSVDNRRAATRLKLLPANGDLMISKDAFSVCWNWLHDEKEIFKLTVAEKRFYRDWLIYQIEEVDWWLRNHAGKDALCSALNLLKRFSRMEQGAIASHADSTFPGPSQRNSVERERPPAPTSTLGMQPFSANDLRYMIPTAPARHGSQIWGDDPLGPSSHSLTDYPRQQIPPGARMTKISRDLVNPAALRDAHMRFEEEDDFVIVSGVLDQDEIEELVVKTLEIRSKAKPTSLPMPS
jgi:hypothetical protein